jgi:hypothetical protein
LVEHPRRVRGRAARGVGVPGRLPRAQSRPAVDHAVRRTRLHHDARCRRLGLGARAPELRPLGRGVRDRGPGARHRRRGTPDECMERDARGVVRERQPRPGARVHGARTASDRRRRGRAAGVHARGARRAAGGGCCERVRREVLERGRRGRAHVCRAPRVRR